MKFANPKYKTVLYHLMRFRVRYSVKNLVALVIGFFLAFSFSAFKFQEPDYVNRLQMAVFLNEVLKKALPDAQASLSEIAFSDLSAAQLDSIALVVDFKIMNGYADSTFRPDEILKNQEFQWYLARAADFLHENAPDSEISEKLNRIAGRFDNDFYQIIEESYSVFSKTDLAYDFASGKMLADLRARLGIGDNSNRQSIEVKIFDAISGKPLDNAFIALDNQIARTDESGNARFLFSKEGNDEKNYELLVSAEGYQTIFLKRNLLQKRTVEIYLKPEITRYKIRAYSLETGEPIKEFSVIVDRKRTIESQKGCVSLNLLRSRSVEILARANGYKSMKKILRSESGKIEIDLHMKSS
ncbi:MAG: hypothetical protein Kow0029_20060 [Candidatus Rifleibacteriota bacterium]